MFDGKFDFKETGVGAVIKKDDELIDPETITISDLIELYGKEAVKRGLGYMASLHEADQNYRENTNTEDFKSGLEDAGIEGLNEDSEVVQKWKGKSEEEGLGLDNE